MIRGSDKPAANGASSKLGLHSSPPVGIATYIAQRLDVLEARLGIFGAGLSIAIVLLACAALYDYPIGNLRGHGAAYGALSEHPFSFSDGNGMQFRFLTSVLGYVLFLRGPLFIFVPLIIACIWPGTIYCHCRSQLITPLTSVSIVALMAFASPILFVLHYPGYIDVTSYLLLFLAGFVVQSLPARAALFALALCNHESNILMAPWLLWLAVKDRQTAANYICAGLSLAAALAPIVIFRAYVKSVANVQFSHEFYLNLPWIKSVFDVTIRGLWLGIFESFKLFWCFPMIAVYLAWKREVDRKDLVSISLAIAGGLAALIFGSDTSRLPGLACQGVIASAVLIRTSSIKLNQYYPNWIWIIVIFNLFVPQYYVGQSNLYPFFSIPVVVFLKYVLGLQYPMPDL